MVECCSRQFKADGKRHDDKHACGGKQQQEQFNLAPLYCWHGHWPAVIFNTGHPSHRSRIRILASQEESVDWRQTIESIKH